MVPAPQPRAAARGSWMWGEADHQADQHPALLGHVCSTTHSLTFSFLQPRETAALNHFKNLQRVVRLFSSMFKKEEIITNNPKSQHGRAEISGHAALLITLCKELHLLELEQG